MRQGLFSNCQYRTKTYWMPFVEQCLRDNVALIAVVGEGAARIEGIIAELVVGYGADDTRFVTTTSHLNETVGEVFEFAGLRNDERNQPVQIVDL